MKGKWENEHEMGVKKMNSRENNSGKYLAKKMACRANVFGWISQNLCKKKVIQLINIDKFLF